MMLRQDPRLHGTRLFLPYLPPGNADDQKVEHLLWILNLVVETPEEKLSEEMKFERLIIYRDSNDAFKDLLLGKFLFHDSGPGKRRSAGFFYH